MAKVADPRRLGLLPTVTPEAEVFWEEARRNRLVVDRCGGCGHCYFPPRRWCWRCERADLIDQRHDAGRVATLYSYTVNEMAWFPGLEVPYVVGLAEFDNMEGVRVPCRVRSQEIAWLQIGARLEVDFEIGEGDLAIPSFVVQAPTEG